jgi:hypothetical protein
MFISIDENKQESSLLVMAAPDNNMRTYSFTIKWICLFLLSIRFTQFNAVAQTPTLVYAKTLGQANQVTLLFSEPVLLPASVIGFSINNGASPLTVARGVNTSTLVLTTMGLTVGGSFTLTINGIQSTGGLLIAANTQAAIDFKMEVPLEFGQAVNGFQDNFNSATMNSAWTPVPSDNNPFTQSGGMLHMNTLTNITGENPVHLFYEPAAGYSSDTQEVLMRMRITVSTESGNALDGVAVGGDPKAGGEAANLSMVNTGGPFVFLFGDIGTLANSGVSVGVLGDPSNPAFLWQTNAWYWLRLRMSTASPASYVNNLYAKIWLSDRSTPEPLEWQTSYTDTMADGDELYAGIEAPSYGCPESFDVDYFLLETPDLPSITVTPNAFPLSNIVYLNITNQPVSEFVPPGQNGTFTANAVGWLPVTVQWQVAPSNGTTFTNVPGATNTTLTVSNVLAALNGNQYQAVFTASDIVKTSIVAVLTTALTPALVFARTGGSNSQVIVQFSEAIAKPSVTNFSINHGVSITRLKTGPTSNEVILTVSPLSLNTNYTLSVTDVSDNYGDVLVSAQTPIDFTVYLPVEFGSTVNGFQDDFSEATINTNWLIYSATAGGSLIWPPPANLSSLVKQTNGNLYIGVPGGAYSPLHVVYAPSAPYNGTNQEVLARIMVTSFVPGAYSLAGVCVCANAGTARAIDWLLGNENPTIPAGPSGVILDDEIVWGPGESYAWVVNTWYWLRESELDGSTYGKIWLADGATPEPAGWQVIWNDNAQFADWGGYAGFTPSDGAGSSAFRVSYVLIEAAGLSNVLVAAPKVFPFTYPTLNLSQTSAGSVTLQWSGDATATLQTAPAVAGPWTPITGATNPHTVNATATAAFFRVKQ